jgi:FtsH-binding integral membrane protein
MGLLKEEGDESRKEQEQEEEEIRLKTCIAYSWSLMVSMIGGLALGWWEYKYHSTNSQLWLVPFGLILLLTPLVVWFSIFVSDICSSEVADGLPRASQLVRPPDDSVSDHDPER